MKLQLSRLDALLVLMTVIWGGNYSVIKAAFREIPPLAFNGVRLLAASTLYLSAIALTARRAPARPRFTRGEQARLLALAVIGYGVYQLLFVEGLARTSVANCSLILGSTPVLVALMTAALGHERIPAAAWAGVVASTLGIYLVVGHGARISGASLAGDLTLAVAVLCWSATAVGSRALLVRHSPLIVTGYSMAIGSALYLAVAWPALWRVEWRSVSAYAWLSAVGSAAFALGVAYMIWYTAIQRIGNTRTTVYSNVVPIVGLTVAWLWLGERIGAVRVAGAAAILIGVALTKVGRAGEPPLEA